MRSAGRIRIAPGPIGQPIGPFFWFIADFRGWRMDAQARCPPRCACGAGASPWAAKRGEGGARRPRVVGRRGLPSRSCVRGRLRPAAFARLRCGARRPGLRHEVAGVADRGRRSETGTPTRPATRGLRAPAARQALRHSAELRLWRDRLPRKSAKNLFFPFIADLRGRSCRCRTTKLHVILRAVTGSTPAMTVIEAPARGSGS
jgi:hypothetical protein